MIVKPRWLFDVFVYRDFKMWFQTKRYAGRTVRFWRIGRYEVVVVHDSTDWLYRFMQG